MDTIVRRKRGGKCSVCYTLLEQDYGYGERGSYKAGSHCPKCFIEYALNPEANIRLTDEEIDQLAEKYAVPTENVCPNCADVAPKDISGYNKFWSCSCEGLSRIYNSTHTEVL